MINSQQNNVNNFLNIFFKISDPSIFKGLCIKFYNSLNFIFLETNWYKTKRGYGCEILNLLYIYKRFESLGPKIYTWSPQNWNWSKEPKNYNDNLSHIWSLPPPKIKKQKIYFIDK